MFEEHYWLIERAFEMASELKEHKKQWMVPCLILQRNMHGKRKKLSPEATPELEIEQSQILSFGKMIKVHGLHLACYSTHEAALTTMPADYFEDLGVVAGHFLDWQASPPDHSHPQTVVAYLFYFVSSLLLLLDEPGDEMFNPAEFRVLHERMISVRFDSNLGMEMLDGFREVAGTCLSA